MLNLYWQCDDWASLPGLNVHSDPWTTAPHLDFHPFLLWRKGEEFCKHCHCLYKCLMLNVLSCLFKLYCEINEPHIILNLNSTIQLMNVEWEKYIWRYEQPPTQFNKPTKYQRRHTWPPTCSCISLLTRAGNMIAGDWGLVGLTKRLYIQNWISWTSHVSIPFVQPTGIFETFSITLPLPSALY